MATDIVRKRLERRKSLDDKIRRGLRKGKHASHNSQIIESLKRQRREVKPSYDVSRSVIYKLKEDYRREQEPVLDVSDIDENYNVLVNDESIQNPFIISSGLVRTIRKHARKYQGAEAKARAIFDWIERNIEYGTSKRTNGYKNTKEVLRHKEGVCGEMAFVYITMARCCGLRSAYVSVDVDCRGEDVCHACAIVDVGYRDILVDPAYHAFDVKHRKYEVLTDSGVLERFNQWRR